SPRRSSRAERVRDERRRRGPELPEASSLPPRGVARRPSGFTGGLLFERCLFCEKPFPNLAFERFPCGRRIAYDPGRTRLWAICGRCHRWNLWPDDERREALYAFERLARDDGYVVAKTANAALLYTKDHVLLRVGAMDLAEEAWWRYGRQLRKRHASFHSRGSRLSAYSF